jgi:hypothetical protein
VGIWLRFGRVIEIAIVIVIAHVYGAYEYYSHISKLPHVYVYVHVHIHNIVHCTLTLHLQPAARMLIFCPALDVWV